MIRKRLHVHIHYISQVVEFTIRASGLEFVNRETETGTESERVRDRDRKWISDLVSEDV